MNIGDLYDGLNVVLNTHKSGNKLTPSEFNSLLTIENINFLKQKVEEIQGYRASVKDLIETMLSSKFLSGLVAVENIVPAAGVYDLTGLATTFGYWLSAVTTAVYNGSIRSIKLVSLGEYEERQVNLLKPPIKEFPIATIKGTNLYVLPTDIGQIEFTHIKIPADPVYDYYIDANRNTVFMIEGGSHTLGAGEVGSAGQAPPTLVNSLTIEPDFEESLYAEFYEFLLLRLGVRAKEAVVIQHAEREQQKDKQI